MRQTEEHYAAFDHKREELLRFHIQSTMMIDLAITSLSTDDVYHDGRTSPNLPFRGQVNESPT
jgi:hypothetical protein